MRIWHQSFTVLGDLPGYEDAMRAHLGKVLRPDTEVVFHGQAAGTYPSDYPGDDIGYGYTYWIHGNQWIAAGRAAQAQGFDAYAMCTLPNPMLREMRSMLDIPVVGMGETCCHLATMFGQRFAIMLFIERMIPLYQEQIRNYGLADRCAGVVPSGLAFADVLSGYADPAAVIEKFQAAARRVIKDTGADVIIPGEVPLNLLMARNGITRVDDVPIIDGLACAMKMAELMADLQQTTGIKHSRHGWFNSVPSQQRLDQVAAFYGVDRLTFYYPLLGRNRIMSSTTSHASPYLPVRDDWLARRTETILEPALPIVDPHHHLWDRPGWRYMLDDLLADTNSGHNIVGTVFVQCRSMHRAGGPEEFRPVGETEFVNGVAAMSASGGYGAAKICAGIVGHVDLRTGGHARDVLEAHIRVGGGRFRGIRHITAYDADPTLMNPAYNPPSDLMENTAFREGFACLAPLNLTFDAWLYHPQIGNLTALARAFPGTGICLNHVGGPLAIGTYAGRRDEIFATWAAAIRELATCPNVVVKLGGMAMRINGWDFHEKADPPSSETLAAAWKPYVETCVAAFGANRCMFESNFPVDKGSYGYAPFWNACKLLAKGASDAEKTDLFSGTAARFYRLDL